MKSIRKIALGVIMAAGAFTAVLYSSCSKTTDACANVTCQHGGSCSSGVCTCPTTGTGGTLCDTVYRTTYSNTYMGTGTDNEATPKTYTDSKLTLTAPADSNYANMNALVQLTATAGGYTTFCSFPIVLSSCTRSGSSSTITSTVYSNGFRYTGSGTVSMTSASLTLTETDTATVSPFPTIVYSWGSMAKQ